MGRVVQICGTKGVIQLKRASLISLFSFLSALFLSVQSWAQSSGGSGGSSDPVATATTSIGTYSTEVTALLLALVMIPISIFGYRMVKKCLGK
jgi:hypothetical protein